MAKMDVHTISKSINMKICHLLVPVLMFLNNSASTQIVTDEDGNSYQTVVIGTQEWFSENLKTTKFNDGTNIPLIYELDEWNRHSWHSVPAYTWYDFKEKYKWPYGALYNWYAVQSEKLCPIGWHVPSLEEYSILREFLGGVRGSGGKMKQQGTLNDIGYWEKPNSRVTNSSGFNAIPGGAIVSKYEDSRKIEFKNMGKWASFWCSDNPGRGYVNGVSLTYADDWFSNSEAFRGTNHGRSVRCVRRAPLPEYDHKLDNKE